MSYDSYQHRQILDKLVQIAGNSPTISGGVSIDLGDVEDDLNTLVSDSTSRNTKLDTINTSVGGSNTRLDTVNSNLGDIETALGDIDTALGDIDTSVDAVNTSVGNVSTNIGLTNGRLDTVNTNLTSSVYGKYGGSVRTRDVTISGATPSLIPPGPLTNRRDMLMMNTSSVTIWVGGSTVSRADGIPVVSGTVFSMPFGGAVLYGVSDNGATVSGVRVLEVA